MVSTPIPTEEMATYSATSTRRAEETSKRRETRRQRALALARRAAAILRDEFGATRVTLFGSVLTPEYFHDSSDLDLAAWGIEESDYLRAVARLLALDPSISVDLVEGERARPALASSIKAEGEEL